MSDLTQMFPRWRKTIVRNYDHWEYWTPGHKVIGTITQYSPDNCIAKSLDKHSRCDTLAIAKRTVEEWGKE